MAEDGWVKLVRKIREHPVWDHDGMLKLFLHCVFEANWKPSKYLVPGSHDVIEVARGQFITGQQVLYSSLYRAASKDSPTSRTVWRWLQNLQEFGCVNLMTVSNRCTVVTVCNYETYQDARFDTVKPDDTPVSRRCHAGVTPVSTSEELNNSKQEEGKREEPAQFVDFPGCNPAIRIIETSDGGTLSWEANRIVWEFEFIRRFNKLQGVAKHSSNALADIEQRSLIDRFKDWDWDWKTAMAMFPTFHEAMPLIEFLKKDMVQKIVAGGMKPYPKGAANGKSSSGRNSTGAGRSEIGAGQRYNPEAAAVKGVDEF